MIDEPPFENADNFINAPSRWRDRFLKIKCKGHRINMLRCYHDSLQMRLYFPQQFFFFFLLKLQIAHILILRFNYRLFNVKICVKRHSLLILSLFESHSQIKHFKVLLPSTEGISEEIIGHWLLWKEGQQEKFWDEKM